MARPEIKIMALSNVYCRLMNFVKKGDYELGHCHTYDHGTLLSSGMLEVEMYEEDGTLVSSKQFSAPSFIFVDKNRLHRLTALEDNTVACCIHALRTIDETILDPDFFVEETILADDFSQLTETTPFIGQVMADRGLDYKPIAFGKKAPDK